MKKNADFSAYPHGYDCRDSKGLTKRELIAAMALQGLLANPCGPIQRSEMAGWSFCNCTEDDVTATALRMADLILAGGNQ
jgi:hypothetical protein